MFHIWTGGVSEGFVSESEDDKSSIANGFVFAGDRSGLRSENSGVRPEMIPPPIQTTPPPRANSRMVQDAELAAQTVLMMGEVEEHIAQLQNMSIATVGEGMIMLDTGCTRSVGGTDWHKGIQD